MSKVASLICAVDTGKRSLEPMAYTTVKTDTQDSMNASLFPMTHYRIQVTFGSQVAVQQDSKDLEQAIYRTKEAVIHEIFGEFREPIHAVQRAVYDRDWHKALDELDVLLKQMYCTDK